MEFLIMSDVELKSLQDQMVQLKNQVLNLEAEKQALDSSLMEYVRNNHQLKTQFILISKNYQDTNALLNSMTKQYQDEKSKVDKLERELKETSGVTLDHLIENSGADKQ